MVSGPTCDLDDQRQLKMQEVWRNSGPFTKTWLADKANKQH